MYVWVLLTTKNRIRSVQSCCISLCTQQYQSAGKFFCHWDAQGWFLYSHVYVYCKLQNYSLYSIMVSMSLHLQCIPYMYLQKTSFSIFNLLPGFQLLHSEVTSSTCTLYSLTYLQERCSVHVQDLYSLQQESLHMY